MFGVFEKLLKTKDQTINFPHTLILAASGEQDNQPWAFYLGGKAATSSPNRRTPSPLPALAPALSPPPRSPAWTARWRSLGRRRRTSPSSSSAPSLPPPTRSRSSATAPSPTTSSPAAGRSSLPVPPTRRSSASHSEPAQFNCMRTDS